MDRAQADLADGRAWKARDRLQGALATAPHDQAILELLGDVAWAMDDLPAAGAAWWLTTRTGREADAARLALEERCGANAVHLLHALKPKAPATSYPPVVVERLRVLVADAQPWNRYAELFEPRRPRSVAPLPEQTWRDTVILGALASVTMGPWVVGTAWLGRHGWALSRATRRRARSSR